MALIAEDYQNEHAFTIIVESLGPIRVWRIQELYIGSLSKRLFDEGGNFKGHRFMQFLVSKCATHLNEENEKEKGKEITVEEVKKLSPEEAEQIAEEVIKHHEYLFVDQNNPVYTQLPPNEQGESLCDISEKKLDIPREEGESASHYLYRLVLVLAEREEIEQEARRKNLSELVNKMSGLGRGFVESFKMPNYNHIIIPPSNPQHTTNEILRDVLNELATQKEINGQLVRTIETNALESKKDTLETTRQGKSSNRISAAALVVAIIALVATVVFGYLSYKASLSNQSTPALTSPASPESPQGEKS